MNALLDETPASVAEVAARAVERAKQTGVCFALIRHTTHTGAIGRYAQWIAGRGCAALLMGSHSARLSAAEAAVPRCNVLFIAIDDLSHWVGYLGRNTQTKTPNIDRLAARGVWFTRSYCAAPVCNPSRAALMSGLRPGASGVYDNSEKFQPAIPTAITLTTQFRKAGYFVCGAGKIYHSSVYRPEEWDDSLRNAGGKAAGEAGEEQPRAEHDARVAEAQRRAYARVDTIGWDGAFCRRDIGYRAIARED